MPFPRRARRPAPPGSGGSGRGPSRCTSCTRPRWWRDGAQFAAGQRRLEQVGRIAGACRAAGADQVWASSMNRMMGWGEACTSSMTWRRRCSNSPFMLAPACSRPMSSEQQAHVLQAAARRPARCAGPSLRPPGLADAGLAREDGGCSGGRRIRMSTICRISSSGVAGFARRRTAVGWPRELLGRADSILGKAVAQVIELDAPGTPAIDSSAPAGGRLEHAQQQEPVRTWHRRNISEP